MSYEANKADFDSRLGGLGFAESARIEGFEDAPANEFSNTYIIKVSEGELNEDNETLSDRYRDNQQWSVMVAFSKSEFNDITNRDDLHRKREDIIKDLDNPSNWGTGVFLRRYQSFTVEELNDYIVLTVNFLVIDQITY